MAPITTTTFDPMLRYVNVRLQQGVPIVDADWNELDDMRKFELRAFLKWFVGDGVPNGNDGFRVTPATAAPNGNVMITVGRQGPAPNLTDGDVVALRHAGRAVVDGLDVMIDTDVTLRGQDLFKGGPKSVATAAKLGVPVVEPMPEAGQVLIYLDVWERLITPTDEPKLVLDGLKVESCARMRREWVVRARAGTEVPKAGDNDVMPDHAYLPLAVVLRRAGTAPVTADDIVDVRQQRLLLPPAHLLSDTLGVDPAAYRRGEQRPPISLRAAVNALIAGELPATDDISVAPNDRTDTGRRAHVLSGRTLLATWTSPRVGSTDQIHVARLDTTDVAAGFGPAEAITTGSLHALPTAVALPGGDVLVAYQTGLTGAITTDVVMKRAGVRGLVAAPEQAVFATAGAADDRPFAVRADDLVVLFSYSRTAANAQWTYRRYNHTGTPAFVDPAPRTLAAAAGPNTDLHAAAAPDAGTVWVAFEANSTITAQRLLTGGVGAVDTSTTFAAGESPFVLVGAADAATVFWKQTGANPGIGFADVTGLAWGAAVAVPESTGETDPAAVRDATGRTWLFTTSPRTGTESDLLARTRHPVTGEWSPKRRVVVAPGIDQQPHPVFEPGQGIWLFWTGNRPTGGPVNFDLYAKRIVTRL